MKKILLPFLFALLGATNVWAAVGDVFTAPVQVVKDGDTTTVQMRFKVAIDMSDYKTCATYATHDELSDTYSPAINYRTEGMVIIPEIVNGYKVETIDSHSFEGCRFSEVELPNTLRFIYYSAFKDCVLLQEIYVPDNVTEILRNAFCGCCNMTKASISCSTIGEKCFYECSKLQSIEFRGPVGAVWTAAFGACSSLSSLSFPAGLHTIYESAFMSCTNLKSIFLPSSLEKIRSGAFDDCTNLSNVIIASETPPAFWPESECAYLFDDLPSDAVLYVPDRTKYNSAPWTKFSQIKSFQPTVEKTISAYFNSSGKLTYVLSYSETIDPNDILDLVIDGEPQLPEVNSGYLTVSKDVTKIPQEVSFLWRKSEGVVPYKLHYDVKNLGFKINGKSMTTLDLYNVPGLVSGEANIITDSDGNPILVLDEAKFEWNDDNYGLLNQSCNLTIQVNSNSTIIADKYEGLKLNESTKTVIGGSGFATLTILSKRAAIDVGDMTHLTIQDGTKVIAQGDSYGYLDSGIYDGDGAYLEIKDGSVFAASGNTESVSLGYRDVILGSGIDLRYPVGATLWNGSVYDADGSKVKGDWVVFGPEGAEALVTPQAYACYTSDNTTLTFYYDKQRNSRTGTTYDLNEVYSNPGWFSDGTRSNVIQVVFDSSFADARPTTTTSWFVEMKNLQSITGLEYLNTSEVTNMRGMFGECISLTSLDLSHFNTAKVTYMDYMFYGCLCLKSIYVGDGWSTTAVTNSEEMFYGCTNLVGSKGTIYDENHIDANYAHIDGGPSNPGYLSQKRGDVNLDGSVDIADAVCVLNAMAGQPVAGDANVNGDYDEDGNPVVDIADLVTVLNIMAGQ